MMATSLGSVPSPCKNRLHWQKHGAINVTVSDWQEPRTPGWLTVHAYSSLPVVAKDLIRGVAGHLQEPACNRVRSSWHNSTSVTATLPIHPAQTIS
jgi:hypothetical protein